MSDNNKNNSSKIVATRQLMLDFFSNNIKPNLIEFRKSKEMTIWSIAILVGLCAAYASLAFRILIGWIQIPWLGTSSDNVFTAALSQPWYELVPQNRTVC